jgi:hypothetical protein
MWASQAHRGGRDLEPQVVVERRRRLLEHLLVAALDRAVAVEQVHDVALAVAEHLDLDVPRLLEVLLQVHLGIAERGARLLLGVHEVRSRSFRTAPPACLDRRRRPRP